MSMKSKGLSIQKQQILKAASLLTQININIDASPSYDSLIKQCEEYGEKADEIDALEWTKIITKLKYLKKHARSEPLTRDLETDLWGPDLTLYPKTTSIYEGTEQRIYPGAQITLGDLHGNALKLFYFLIKEGFINMSSEDYNLFIGIYKKDPLDKKSIEEFHQILTRVTVPEQAQLATMRLIGDVMGDRGQNDYFTLKILEKLNENNVPMEILFSNHDLEFIEHYENNFKTPYFSLGKQQAKSVFKLDDLIERGVVDKKTVDNLVKTHYLPNLLAISYSIDDNFKPPHLTLYTHAPVGLTTIYSLARKFKIPLPVLWDSDAYSIARVIDAINAQFKIKAMGKMAITKMLYDEGYENPDKVHQPSAPLRSPLIRIAWTRKNEDVEYDDKNKLVYKDTRTRGILGKYSMSYVHGHDGEGEVPEHEIAYVKNIDNLFGKNICYLPNGTENNLGSYYADQTFAKTSRMLNLPKIEVTKTKVEKKISVETTKQVDQQKLPDIKTKPDQTPTRRPVKLEALTELKASKDKLNLQQSQKSPKILDKSSKTDLVKTTNATQEPVRQPIRKPNIMKQKLQPLVNPPKLPELSEGEEQNTTQVKTGAKTKGDQKPKNPRDFKKL